LLERLNSEESHVIYYDVELLVLQDLLVIEEQIPLALEYIVGESLGDEVILTAEPVVLMLTNETRVVSGVSCASVVYDGIQGILVFTGKYRRRLPDDLFVVAIVMVT
jgi:hypothetical protein